MERAKIVTIGGGSGHSTLLRGLIKENYPPNITACFTTADSGGSSGLQRIEEGVLPPGDYMKCIIGCVEDDDQFQAAIDILNERDGGHPLANLLGAKSERKYHGVEGGINGIRRLLRVRANILPVSLVDLHLIARTKKGRFLTDEHEIDNLKNEPNFHLEDSIWRIYPSSKVPINPAVKEKIEEADIIIIAPGSPYTSIFVNFLISGMSEAIMNSRAKLVAVANLMRTRGEDHPLQTLSSWVKECQYYLKDDKRIKLGQPSRINYILANNNHPEEEMLKLYEEGGQYPIQVDKATCELLAPGLEVIKAPLALYDRDSHLFRHERSLVAQAILKLN